MAPTVTAYFPRCSDSLLEMWWLIGRCGGSLLEDVVAYWEMWWFMGRYGGLLLEIGGLIGRCGGSLLEDEVAYWEMWWLIGDTVWWLIVGGVVAYWEMW